MIAHALVRLALYLGWTLLGALALAAALAAGVYLLLRRSLPRTRGRIRLAGLRAPVEVVRDVDAVPHIYGSSRDDVYFGLGFVHAQERLWQMEFQRRMGGGRLAEVFGAAMVPTDRFVRTVGLHRAARSAWEGLPGHAREAVEAYVAGINAFLATHRGSRLPPEFLLLRARPEPWTGEDVLTCAKLMAWNLSGTYMADLLRDDIARKLGPERAKWLMLDLDDVAEAPPLPAGEAPAPRETVAPLRIVSDMVEATGAGGEGIGSNQWAVSGERSATGRPVLAADPHLNSSMPGIWYVAHLCGDGLDVIGATLPGIPTVLIGRTRRIAWGISGLGHDVQDLFRERLDETGTEAVFGEGVEPVRRLEERIRVRGKPDVVVTVRVTRHGPLISDALNANELERPPEKRREPREPLAFRWTALDEGDGSLAAFLRVNEAGNWDEFVDALRGYVAPIVVFGYADVQGDIGCYVPGRIPLRAGGDGSLPAEGWSGAHEWTGWIPFEELPHLHNPPEHFVASANTRVVPEGYRHYLGHEFMEPHRSERIAERILAGGRLTPEDHAAIQRDSVSLHARKLLPLLLPLAVPRTDRARWALELLAGWDHDMRGDSAAAAVFAAWWLGVPRALLGEGVGEMGDEMFRAYEVWTSHVDRFVRNTLAAAAGPEAAPADRERLGAAVGGALEEGLALLAARLGDDPARWRWDGVHAAVFPHLPFHRIGFLRRFVSRSLPMDGDWSTVNVGGSWTSARPFEQRYVAAYRQVVDLSRVDGGVFVQAIGQSGHFLSPHYADFAADWREGRYRPLRLERSTVERDRRATLHLEPRPARAAGSSVPHPSQGEAR